MPLQPQTISLPDAEFEAFDLLNFGSLEVQAEPCRFGFQVDLTPSMALSQVVFGMVQQGQRLGTPNRVGFAVRLDLTRGEIWDLVNDSGLIGWVEESLGCKAGEPQQPILLSLEIERIGSALLPKLQIGGEEWLYPALRNMEQLELVAVAGTGVGSSDALSLFSNPAVWTEQAAKL